MSLFYNRRNLNFKWLFIINRKYFMNVHRAFPKPVQNRFFLYRIGKICYNKNNCIFSFFHAFYPIELWKTEDC